MLGNNYIPVENRPGLYRDPATNAIINMNTSGAEAARNARQKAIQRDQDIENLKSDMAEIKQLLMQLLESKN